MLVRKWRDKPDVVILTVTVASVSNHKPIIGFNDDVEKVWKNLQKKHRIKDRHLYEKTLMKSSSSNLVDETLNTTSDDKLSKSTATVYVTYHLIRSDRGHFIWNRANEPAQAEALTIKL